MHLFKSQTIIDQKAEKCQGHSPNENSRHNGTWDLLEKCHLQEWSRLRMSFAFEISWPDSAPDTATKADVIRKYLAVETLSNTTGIQSRNRILFSWWSRRSGRSVSNESRLNQYSLRLPLCWCATGILCQDWRWVINLNYRNLEFSEWEGNSRTWIGHLEEMKPKNTSAGTNVGLWIINGWWSRIGCGNLRLDWRNTYFWWEESVTVAKWRKRPSICPQNFGEWQFCWPFDQVRFKHIRLLTLVPNHRENWVQETDRPYCFTMHHARAARGRCWEGTPRPLQTLSGMNHRIDNLRARLLLHKPKCRSTRKKLIDSPSLKKIMNSLFTVQIKEKCL
jgi:hypothetical protein